MATIPNISITNNPAYAKYAGQFSAIQNGANSGSLVDQLYAGKPSTVPVAQKPQTVAASSVVKNPATPKSTPPVLPPQTGFSALSTSVGGHSILPGSDADSTYAPINIGVSNNKASQDAAATPPVPPTPLQQSIASQQNIGSTQNSAVTKGNAAIEKAGEDIQNLRTRAAALENAYNTTGLEPVAEGLNKNVADTEAAQESAIQTGITNQNTAVANTLTGQNQQISALNNAGQLSTPNNQFIQQGPANTLVGANGQPINQIGGATNLTSPMTGQPFASTGNPQADAAVVAALQQIKNGAGYDNAVSATNLGLYGTKAITALQSGLPAGFNPNASNASATATAQNIGATGTAQTTAANTAYQTAVQNVSKATGQYTAATGIAKNLTDTLGNWTQNGNLTNLNQAINKVAGLTSSPQYAQFQTALTNTQAAYAAAFQTAGITPTQSTQNALQELNPNSSATTIIASLNQLSSDLHAATIIPAYQQEQTYAQQLGITQ